MSRPDKWASGGWSVLAYLRTSKVDANTTHAICRTRPGFTFRSSGPPTVVDEMGGHVVFDADSYLNVPSIAIQVPFAVVASVAGADMTWLQGLARERAKGRLHVARTVDFLAGARPFASGMRPVEPDRLVVLPATPGGDPGEDRSFDVDWSSAIPSGIISSYARNATLLMGSVQALLGRSAFEMEVCEELVFGTALGFLGPGGSITVAVKPGDVTLESAYVMYGEKGAEARQREPATSRPVAIEARPGLAVEYVLTPFSSGPHGIMVEKRR